MTILLPRNKVGLGDILVRHGSITLHPKDEEPNKDVALFPFASVAIQVKQRNHILYVGTNIILHYIHTYLA